MTYQEFVKKLERRVKRSKRRVFRLEGTQIRTCRGGKCPLEYFAGVPEGCYRIAAARLGMREHTLNKIMLAADSSARYVYVGNGDYTTKPIRGRHAMERATRVKV